MRLTRASDGRSSRACCPARKSRRKRARRRNGYWKFERALPAWEAQRYGRRMTDPAAMTEAEAANRLMRLAKEIARHNRLYHDQDQPEITDAQYDALMRENNALEAAFPQL